MAIYKAISNGNADNLAIWETWDGAAWVAASVLPNINDDVYTNNNIVTVTTSQSYNSLNRSSLSSPVIAQGGQFQITGANEITLEGLVNGSNASFASVPLSACVNRLATHINKFHRIGDDVGGSSNNCYAFWNGSTYNIDIIGNQTGGSGNCAFGFYNNAMCTFNSIIGNQSGGSVIEAYGFYNGAANTLFLDIMGAQSGIPNNFGFYNTGNLCEITFVGSEAYPQGIYNISNSTIINFGGRSYNDLQTGVMAIRSNGNVDFDLSEFRIGLTPTLNEIVLYPDSVLENPPAESDTRSGIVYGIANNYTGTCAVPPTESVVKNVPVDDTVGTWAFDDDLILRLKKCSTTEEVNSSIAAYNS